MRPCNISPRHLSLAMVKYSKELNHQFAQELKQKVGACLAELGRGKQANLAMIFKSVWAVLFYYSVYALILSGMVQNLYALFLLWAMLGIGQAFVGMGVMHDVLHNAYTNSKWVKALMEIPIHSIGIVSGIWKMEHNQVHHTHTNVEQLDQDIHPMLIFRFSPHQPRRWFHRFQHLYAPFFYGFRTLTWVTTKDFITAFKYHQAGKFNSSRHFIQVLLGVLLNKAVFFALFLGVPLLVMPHPWYLVVCLLLTMLFVSGLYMATVFQLAHVVPLTHFYEANHTQQFQTWHIHQLLTTSNFSTTNKWLTYLTGGLNHQVEHHLFPDISHVHYPLISTLVKQTAHKYGIPYHEYGSVKEALVGHFGFLKALGKAQ